MSVSSESRPPLSLSMYQDETQILGFVEDQLLSSCEFHDLVGNRAPLKIQSGNYPGNWILPASLGSVIRLGGCKKGRAVKIGQFLIKASWSPTGSMREFQPGSASGNGWTRVPLKQLCSTPFCISPRDVPRRLIRADTSFASAWLSQA
ncbi:hypothetical protein K435DRAFT_854453 [Dendrothele bispora CBS 962.96]|uniref:Uncharacterized protein n=1 Tax=Dendrothele bispora (strain CBS 962.96) TaxID=1314807 RepID=A0A4V4HH00_DENBC|nr:hypothetical protein K435DRAFT_854453 [Dendrothele bispora CBS 962.96]